MPKTIIQFAYREIHQHKDMALTVDCRGLRNPWRYKVADTVLREQVRLDPSFESVVARGVHILNTHDTIYVGCQFGKHRSVAVAEEIAKRTGATVTRERPCID